MAQCRPHGMKVFAQLWHGGNLYNAYDGDRAGPLVCRLIAARALRFG